MAKITSLRTINNDKMELKVEVNSKELGFLQGQLENIHIFSEKNLTLSSRLVQRGKRESTRYFLMPREFRSGVLISNNINCNIIETKTKRIFIFETEKY